MISSPSSALLGSSHVPFEWSINTSALSPGPLVRLAPLWKGLLKVGQHRKHQQRPLRCGGRYLGGKQKSQLHVDRFI